MNIHFAFMPEVNGHTIVSAVQHVYNFLDVSLMDTATVHPLKSIHVNVHVNGEFSVLLMDDAGRTNHESFYYDPVCEQWLPMAQHPFVKAGVLLLPEEEDL